jgi:hypothetical protein
LPKTVAVADCPARLRNLRRLEMMSALTLTERRRHRDRFLWSRSFRKGRPECRDLLEDFAGIADD